MNLSQMSANAKMTLSQSTADQGGNYSSIPLKKKIPGLSSGISPTNKFQLNKNQNNLEDSLLAEIIENVNVTSQNKKVIQSSENMNLLGISKNANNQLKDILEEQDGGTGDRRFQVYSKYQV